MLSTTIITSAIAVSTDACSWSTIEATSFEVSIEMSTRIASCSSSGHSATEAATLSRTSSAVSMTLKPLRLTICSATVGSPL